MILTQKKPIQMTPRMSTPLIERGFFLCIDKPAGMTSHDVVAMMRFFLQTRKIGHTGTLDPFATGVLVLAVGSATRLIQYLPAAPKNYHMQLQLGAETETADCDGQVVQKKEVPSFSQADIERLSQKFTGNIEQKPPLYSAIKVNGKRLYEYARAGIPVDIPSRRVDIYSFQAQKTGDTLISGQIECAKGTYIRSLGVDLAKELGTLGYLSALRRMSSDGFSISSALSMEALSQIVAGTDNWQEALRKGGEAQFPRVSQEEIISKILKRACPIEQAFQSIQRWEVGEDTAKKLAFGISPVLSLDAVEGMRGALVHRGTILAIAEKRGKIAKLLRVISKSPINDKSDQ